MSPLPKELRNVAIIAHVDHGKTTLVDALLKQSGTFEAHENVQDRVMDSMDLERERGITIAAKNTAVYYGSHKINIIDTPGHADFGGEVERILSMVDGACLLVDASEGPLPQTRYVLGKALEQKKKVIVVINKVDRKDARADEVLNEIFDLFIELGADEEQCDFPCFYAIAKDGIGSIELEEVPHSSDLKGLLNLMVDLIPAPDTSKAEGPAQVMISHLSYSDYLGRLVLGKVHGGSLKKNMQAVLLGVDEEGKTTQKKFKISALFTYHGLKQVPVDEVSCGDIALVGGLDDACIGDTIVGAPDPTKGQLWEVQDHILPRIAVDEPTLEIDIYVNDSPFAGKEGKFVTSRKIKERLEHECFVNVAINIRETVETDRFRLAVRGELQVAILAETMRREGFEFALGQPQIIYKKEGEQILEPIELATLDIPEEAQGKVTQMFQEKKGLLQKIESKGQGRTRIELLIPSRGLIGLRSKFITETRGEGLFNLSSAGYEAHKGDIVHRSNGALVADRDGNSNAYALENLQNRGILFIGTQTPVYVGMIIGEHARNNDLNVNATKAKQLTNFRTSNTDDAIKLTPPRKLTIENALEWIRDDELLEITPENLRVRKKALSPHDRK